MNEPPKRIVYDWYPSRAPADQREGVGPFTVEWLREKIRFRVRGVDVPSDKLAQLATLLNTMAADYRGRGGATANRRRAAEVRYATWVLMRFFAERRQACKKVGVAKVVKSELRLCDQFDNLMEAMAAHSWTLDMDTGLTRPPQGERGRDFAHWIALAFKLVLEESGSRPLGFTNTGPIAWLTAEAIGAITDKPQEAYNIGQHLKQPHEKKTHR
jgi:hypothetical protein